MTEPEKWGLEFKPKVLCLYHSNTIWSMPGNVEVWQGILRNLEFIFAVELFHNETSTFADILLPDSTYLESWALLMCEPPITEGHVHQSRARSPEAGL